MIGRAWLKLAFVRKTREVIILGVTVGERDTAETVALAEAPAKSSLGLFDVTENDLVFAKRLQAWLENRGLGRAESQRVMREIGKAIGEAMNRGQDQPNGQ
jgi:hypothetical protein